MQIDNDHPGLRSVFSSIARWVESYRERLDPARQFEGCDAEQVAAIARDLMLSPSELMTIARKGPDGARLLYQMLRALGVNPKRLAGQDAVVMRDLQRLCVNCGYKRQCEHDLSEGKGAENYQEYCPNAYTLSLLVQQVNAAPADSDPASASQH
jgi:hypothetical protein